jgi:hypothetical protein
LGLIWSVVFTMYFTLQKTVMNDIVGSRPRARQRETDLMYNLWVVRVICGLG